MEFKSVQEALEMIGKTEPGTALRLKAVSYLAEHMTPKMEEELGRLIGQAYPALKPDWYDETGKPYWNFETAAKVLEIPEADREGARDFARELPGGLAGPEAKLHRRQ
jgi:hypothetical protein